MATTQAPGTDRADRVAARLAGPVLVAALASIPATFLTLLEGTAATVGTVLNTVSGAVLVAETVVLLVLAEDKRAWLRRNRWLLVLTAVIVPAVLFAVGPVQLLRLVRGLGLHVVRLLRGVGALRIVRVRRILRAGRVIRERHGLTGRGQRITTAVLTGATAVFVAIVLADPTSQSRRLLDDAAAQLGVAGVLTAGGLLAAATWVVRTRRR